MSGSARKASVPMVMTRAEVRRRFLRALVATGNVRSACRAAGVSKMTPYNHRERFPRFGEEWDAALEAHRRIEAVIGA